LLPSIDSICEKITAMIGRTLGHYRIVSAIGTGGMGEVYRATDTKLNRNVALKVLPLDVAGNPERLERFQREARALAALDHPGIVSVFSVEEADGVHFLTMQLVEGQSLDHLIPKNGFPRDQFWDLAEQLSESLSAAHNKGIIHRDLKPGNIMVGDRRRVKVLDFGLAKLAVGSSETGDSQLQTEMRTSDGLVMGTVPYMSPEQLTGKAVDTRSDVFSVGVILYEMATGTRPFHGNSSAEVISSILRDTPSPLAGIRIDLTDVARVIERCLEKDPGKRYRNATEVFDDLTMLKSAPLSVSSVPATAPVARQKRFWRVAAILIGLIGSIGLIWKMAQPRSAATRAASIAVIPFINGSGNPDDEYFSDGMTDELASELMKVPGLRVAARSSAFSFKGKAIDAREAGKKLNVATVVEGSVRRAGPRVRVTVQLVNVADGLALWSERYEREMKDVFAVQDDITGAIVSALRLQLAPAPNQNHTENAEAHDLYLRGRFFMLKQTEEGLRKSLDYFNQSLAKDPNYAPAYAGIGFAWAYLADAFASPAEAYPKAKAAIAKALELDPSNAVAHTMSAAIKWVYVWDVEGAKQELVNALRLNPNSMDAHNFYGQILCSAKEFDKGLAEEQRAIDLDPLNAWPHWGREYCLCMARRYDETIEEHKKTQELDPNFYYLDSWAGVAYREKKMYAESLAEYQHVEQATGSPVTWIAITYARMGNTAEAKKILQQSIELSHHKYVAPELIAAIYSELGDHEQAFSWFNKGFEIHSAVLPVTLLSPAYDPLRSDPRFRELLKKMNLEK
jgi:serine/threonine protein kinase/tetratricopeptide (TPR) repeat protein